MSDEDKINKQYDRAISLIAYYVQLMWLIFGAFLVSETVLLAAIASVAKDGPKEVIFGGAVLGLLLALPWWASFAYNHAIYLLRVMEARALEPQAGTFFSSGYELIKGQTINDPKIGKISIPLIGRVLTPVRAVRLLILSFVIAFGWIAFHYRPNISILWN